MTGINASKIIQNSEIVHSFAPHHCSRVRCSVLSGGTKRKKKREKKLFLPIFIFSISEIGSGANPHSPGWGGGGWPQSLFRLLNWGPRIQNWDPILGIGTLRLAARGAGSPALLVERSRVASGFKPIQFAVYRDMLVCLQGLPSSGPHVPAAEQQGPKATPGLQAAAGSRLVARCQ